MNENLRQKKIARLIKEAAGTELLTSFQDMDTGLISITKVEISKDLKTAYVYFSVLGAQDDEQVLDRLKSQQKSVRKAVASRIKLKYNPKLIFALDSTSRYEKRIDELLDNLKQDEQ